MGKFGPENLFKPHLKPISGVPEIGFRKGLNTFSDPNFSKPYPKAYLENLVEYPTCPLHGTSYAEVARLTLHCAARSPSLGSQTRLNR